MIVSEESQSAGQKTTNQNGHCHGYTHNNSMVIHIDIQLKKIILLAVDLPLFDVMFSK